MRSRRRRRWLGDGPDRGGGALPRNLERRELLYGDQELHLVADARTCGLGHNGADMRDKLDEAFGLKYAQGVRNGVRETPNSPQRAGSESRAPGGQHPVMMSRRI